MAAHSSILAWRIPWTEEPSGLQSMGSQSQTQLSDYTQVNLSDPKVLSMNQVELNPIEGKWKGEAEVLLDRWELFFFFGEYLFSDIPVTEALVFLLSSLRAYIK